MNLLQCSALNHTISDDVVILRKGININLVSDLSGYPVSFKRKLSAEVISVGSV